MERFGDILFKSSLVLFVALTPVSIAMTEGSFWLALIGYVTNKLSSRKPLFCATGVEKPIIAFIAALVFASFFSIKPLYSLSSIGSFRFFLLYYMLASYGLKRDFIRKLVVLIILMTVTWSLYETFEYFQMQTKSHRLNIYTAHINVLVIPILVGLLFLERVEKKKKAFLLLFLFILSMVSFLSLSRAAWVGTFAVVTLVMFYRNWKITVFLVLGMAIVAFIIASYYPDSTIGGLISSIVNPFQRGGVRFGSNMERLQMLKDAASILKKNPLTGIGPEAYRFVSTGKHKHMRISMDHVQILATAGLIGFVTYVWLMFGFVRRCLKTEQTERRKGAFGLYHILSICFFAALVGFLVCGSFEPNFFSTKRLKFMMLLLGMNECLFKTSKIKDSENDTDEK